MTVVVRALHAEWTKLRTVRSSGWLLLGVAALTIGLGALIAWSTRFEGCPPTGSCGVDPPRIALSGVYVGQIAAVVLGALAVSSEYATGTVRATLAAVPRRWPTSVAKAAVVAGPVLLAGALAVVGSFLVARAVLPANGFTTAHGFPPLSLGDSATLRAGVGTALYLFLIAVLSVGVALVVRSTAAAISGVLALLFAFPILASVVSDPEWREWLTEWSPMTAGLAVQATVRLDGMPGPWEGVAVLAAYAGAALLLGGVLFQVRDA